MQNVGQQLCVFAVQWLIPQFDQELRDGERDALADAGDIISPIDRNIGATEDNNLTPNPMQQTCMPKRLLL